MYWSACLLHRAVLLLVPSLQHAVAMACKLKEYMLACLIVRSGESELLSHSAAQLAQHCMIYLLLQKATITVIHLLSLTSLAFRRLKAVSCGQIPPPLR